MQSLIITTMSSAAVTVCAALAYVFTRSKGIERGAVLIFLLATIATASFAALLLSLWLIGVLL